MIAALIDRHAIDMHRQDLRFGILDAIVCNLTRDPKKGKRAKAEDFLLSGSRRPRRQEKKSPENLLVLAEFYNEMLGGKDLRKKNGGQARG